MVWMGNGQPKKRIRTIQAIWKLPLVGIIKLLSFSEQIQGVEALRDPILPLRLLPLVCHLQQLRHLCRGRVVCREHIIHVLLEAVVVELSPLLDLAGHLLVDFFNV